MPVIKAKKLRVRRDKNSPWTDVPAVVNSRSGGGGGVSFTPGNALELTEDGVLNVKTAPSPEPDNTLPITSAGVAATVGNIEVILKTI